MLRRVSVNPGTLHGGVKINMLPAECVQKILDTFAGILGVMMVVTDLDVMPIGGFTLARAIHRRYAQVPVAIVTTRATTTMAARALARGVTLLPRPVEVAKLVQAVHKLISPGRPSVPLAVLSETGTSFVPLRARSSPMPAARLR